MAYNFFAHQERCRKIDSQHSCPDVFVNLANRLESICDSRAVYKNIQGSKMLDSLVNQRLDCSRISDVTLYDQYRSLVRELFDTMSRAFWSMSHITTFAPPARKANATDFPRPPAPPVTRHVLSDKSLPTEAILARLVDFQVQRPLFCC